MSPATTNWQASRAEPTRSWVKTPVSCLPCSSGISESKWCTFVPPSATRALWPLPSHAQGGDFTIRTVERSSGIVYQAKRTLEEHESKRACLWKRGRGRTHSIHTCVLSRRQRCQSDAPFVEKFRTE
eukprot:2376573-Prymnesium_polylepis.1